MAGNITQGNVLTDAATANMLSPWRMPTKAQFEELTDYTTHTWTTINGVVGRKFTNKSDASKYIFLPAAGRYDNTTHADTTKFGYYLSTARYSSSDAQFIAFRSSSVYMDYSRRYYGYSIRGIQ